MYMSGTKHLCRYRDIGTSSLRLLQLFDIMKLMPKSDEVLDNIRFRNNCILLVMISIRHVLLSAMWMALEML